MALIQQLALITSAKETTWGTGVTATVKRMDVTDAPQPDAGAKFIQVPSIRGGMSKNAYVVARASEVPPAFSWKHFGSYEDVSYLLEGMTGVVTPTGAGPYVRAGVAPLTAVVAAPRIETLYVSNLDGADGFFYKYLGTIAKKIAFSCKSGDYLSVDVERLAKQMTTADATVAATGTLTDRTMTPIMGNDLLLYLDAVGGTIGTTALTPAGYEYKLELDSGRVTNQQLGGVNATQYIEGDWSGKLELKLIWSAANKAYVDAMFGTATAFQKQVRAKFTTGASQILQLDFAGTSLASPKINEGANDTVVVTISMSQNYNSALGNWFKYSNTNSTATLA